MSSENLHAPRDRLSHKTLHLHHAIISLMEELDAVDWYRQRADDCEDEALREILLHNMREEIEHACMALEWLRRNDSDFDRQLRTYLFTETPITEIEEVEEAQQKTAGRREEDLGTEPPPHRQESSSESRGGFTVGSLKT